MERRTVTFIIMVLIFLSFRSMKAQPAHLMTPPLPIITQQLPDDVAFCIIDLKYHAGRNDRIKICELGQGMVSGFIGHYRIFGEGKIWQGLWDFFSKLNLPVTLHAKKDTDVKRFTHDILDDFLKYPNNSFSDVIPNNPKKFIFLSLNYNYFVQHYDVIKASNPNALVLDDATRVVVLNKALTHIFFTQDPLLARLRPQCKILPKYYDQHLAKNIIDAMPAQHYVIKPISGKKGRGIIFVEQKKLSTALKALFTPHRQHYYTRHINPEQYNYWRQEKSNFFMIESYEPSQAITVHRKKYDATMRVAVGMAHINGALSLDFFSAYWKLPKSPLDNDAPFDMQHLSHIEPGTICSAPVDDAIYHDVKNILTAHLPALYRQMIAARYDPFFLPLIQQQLVPQKSINHQ